jgi:hypothetical protein
MLIHASAARLVFLKLFNDVLVYENLLLLWVLILRGAFLIQIAKVKILLRVLDEHGPCLLSHLNHLPTFCSLDVLGRFCCLWLDPFDKIRSVSRFCPFSWILLRVAYFSALHVEWGIHELLLAPIIIELESLLGGCIQAVGRIETLLPLENAS